MDKAVILAAGRGSRMRRVQESSQLTASQAEIARTGLKAMMPVGRPFIDYVLSGLADAGYREVCLVIGPDHGALSDHVRSYKEARLKIHFAIQPDALGTANALAASSEFVGDDSFLLINSDNYYPGSALHGLRSVEGSAVAAFRPEGLLRGHIPAERLRNYAVLPVSQDGILERVVEKPGEELFSRLKDTALISMNCWRFTPIIFDACRTIPRSARNEYELTDAVSYTIAQMGERFKVLVVNEPVLDLSTQADVSEVARRLASIEVRL